MYNKFMGDFGVMKKYHPSPEYLNSETYMYYFDRLCNLALNTIEWTGLPETVNLRWLELIINISGRAIIFEDDVYGFVGLRCANQGPIDIYNEPIKRIGIAASGYTSKIKDSTNSVIIYNNYMRCPTQYSLHMFARRLSELDRTIDVNVKAQKTPVLITCDENERLTMLNAYKKYDGNTPVIFGSRAMSANKIEAITTTAEFVSDKLQLLKQQIWNEALSYLGIENVPQIKKSNLAGDEVEKNTAGIMYEKYVRINARKQAADQMNALWDWDCDVNFRSIGNEMVEFINQDNYSYDLGGIENDTPATENTTKIWDYKEGIK